MQDENYRELPSKIIFYDMNFMILEVILKMLETEYMEYIIRCISKYNS